MKIYDITEFGAIGDGVTDNAKAFQKTIDECSQNGGGIVRVPGGNVFMTGPFDLKSFVNLHVESGAKIMANPNKLVYTKSAFRDNLGEGTIWIGGENAEKVSITGQGTIDGNGIRFMGEENRYAYELLPFDVVDPRPHVFTPINFTNLTIKDVTFTNAAYWCIHLVGCTDVSIQGIRILNSLKVRNSDGIDIDHSRNVRISHCFIESGDDCICFKTRREYETFGPTENVTVSNCIMKSTSCSIKLGSENMDAIRNVMFSNCIIQSSNRGIGIQNRDEGVVENIIFESIIIEGRLFDDVWWGKAEPIYVTSYKRENANGKDAKLRFAKGQKTGEVGVISNVLFSNITCKSENGIFVGGENGKINNIKFLNVQLEIDKTTGFVGGQYDLRPSAPGIIKVPTSGFYLDEAGDIELRNCSVRWGKRKADYFNACLDANHIQGLVIENLKGEHARNPKLPNSVLVNCTSVLIKE